MISNRYRLDAEAGRIAGKGEKHTPLGPNNDSDSHAVVGVVVVTAEKTKDQKIRFEQSKRASKVRLFERRVKSRGI
jgi:hypothetical protein